MILLDAAMAVAWTGRPAGTLRRWVHEGKLTRYGRPRAALYDLAELPPRPARHDRPIEDIA